MITDKQIIDSARRRLGIKYQNQGRDYYGLDCGGLLLVVCRELGITDLEHLSYSNSPDGETFEKLLLDNLEEVTPKENIRCSYIFAANYGAGIQHCGFITQIPTPERSFINIIHAKRGRGVIEHRFYNALQDFRCWTRTFRIRNIEYTL